MSDVKQENMATVLSDKNPAITLSDPAFFQEFP